MNAVREREVNWPLVRTIYDDICSELTWKQYNKWLFLPSGESRYLNYYARFARLSTVTANRKLLKKARAAMFEISGVIHEIAGASHD